MEILKGLESYVAKVRTSFSGDPGKWADYLAKYQLSDYFGKDSDGKVVEKRPGDRSLLEEKVNEAAKKYSEGFSGVIRKVAAKGTMGAALAYQVYGLFSNAAIQSIGNATYGLFVLKTLAEAPYLAKYLKKSHDWYGAIYHNLLKPVRAAIPFIGPAFEAGAFERMVRKRIMYEARNEFLKEVKSYVPLEDRIKESLKKPIGSVLKFPEQGDGELRKVA